MQFENEEILIVNRSTMDFERFLNELIQFDSSTQLVVLLETTSSPDYK